MKPDFSALEKEIQSGEVVTMPEFLSDWLAKPRPLFIDGKWENGESSFPSINPATEETLAEVFAAGKAQVDRAVTSARRIFDSGVWAQESLERRAAIVRRLGDLILEHRAPLAILESLDTGKPLHESFNGDIPRAASNFHFFADFSLQESGAIEYPNAPDKHVAWREPLGVAVLITPWNLPLYLETWKIAPALMMGNSIILKPSELTPLTAAYFADLVEQSGLPAGVFQLVQGFGEKAAGEFLTSHPGIDAISFTGETSTGRAIMKCAAVGPTRISFELGGKGASLVFADADFPTAVSETARAAFRNQGEICLACPRIFVERSRYAEFVDAFVKKAREIQVGNPLSYKTTMGALIGREHYEKVTGYLKRVESPGKILTGGVRPKNQAKGYFLEPTVITDIGLDHPISREEVFGPVVSIYPFDSESEVIAAANGTPYGLSASVWTNDTAKADRVARALRSGLIWINCWFVRDLRVPFGGQKRSGVGREGGKHSLDFFSEWKSVCTKGGA